MRAICVTVAGGPDVLHEVQLPLPEPGPGEVRVRLARIGLNFADVMCRRGTHPGMRQPPIVPGCEAAGVVDSCGAGTTRVRAGDRVGLYSPFGGAYAEAIVVPEDYVLPLPEAMDFETAAAGLHTSLTAYFALHGVGDGDEVPSRGRTMLVTAAAGGLGGMLLQLGQAAGLDVLACVGSPTKAGLLRARGWPLVIDYGSAPLNEQIVALFGERPADLVVETVGDAIYAQAELLVAPLGRIVIAGNASGKHLVTHAGAMLARSARCQWLNLSVMFIHRPDIVRRAWHSLTEMHQSGMLEVRVSRCLPIADVATAHAALEGRATVDSMVMRL